MPEPDLPPSRSEIIVHITHPHPALGRQKFIGIEFRDGYAEVETLHPEVEAALLQHGYGIEETLADDSAESPFEPLPEAVEGDTKPKTSKPRGRKATLVIEDEAPGVTVEDLEHVAELGRSLPESFIADAWAGDVPEIVSED